jgi:hypothetical protein
MEMTTPGKSGRSTGVIDDFMSLVEQKETAERVLEMAAMESSILDAIPQAIVGLHNRRIIFANYAIKGTSGWRREEFISQSVSIFYRNKKESDEIARHFYATPEQPSPHRCRTASP